MNTESELSPIVRSILEDLRDSINGQFRMRVKRGLKLEPNDFSNHVRNGIGPVIDVVHAAFPERARNVCKELIDLSFTLFEANQLGSQARSSALEDLWRTLFPKIANVISGDPKRIVGRLCNALYFLEQRGKAKSQRWISLMKQFAPLIEQHDQLLSLGKVVGWVSGLPQYRSSAIEEADKIPWRIVAGLLQIADPTEARTRQLLMQLSHDPWSVEAKVVRSEQQNAPQIRLTCGGFRGFGGGFILPPRVVAVDKQFYIIDGQDVWALYADCFGFSTIRTELKPTQLVPNRTKQPTVADDGLIRWGDAKSKETALVRPTSQAFDGQTLAVTTQSSFHVFLVTFSTGAL